MTSHQKGPDPAFFSNGVMYAALNCVGNTPDDSDLLNSSVMNGANTSTLSLRRCVGTWKWIGGALLGRKLAAGVNDVINAESAER